MYIGELSKRTGASPKALRLYETLGLLGEVPRKGSYRLFSEENVQQVLLIRQAKKLGFLLSEMQEVVESENGYTDWDKLLHQIALKRASIRKSIKSMTRIEKQLEQVANEIKKCTANPTHSQCDSLTAEIY